MIIGLLICDHINAEYQKEFGDYPEMFQAFLPTFDFKYYDAINGELPESISECDLFMATGSRHSVYEDLDWIKKLLSFIKTLHDNKKTYVGFCFGHQLIGQALGGRVEKAKTGWCVGSLTFKMTKRKKWQDPYQEEVNLLMMCQDQISQLPPGTERIATNPLCINGIIQIEDHILGIQAHPEFSKNYDQHLMETRKNRIGEEAVKKGIKSLEQTIDRETIRTWIINFINKSI